MLLDMLTADVAAKHGQDYAPHRSPSPHSNGSFIQMPLSMLGSVLRKRSQSPAPLPQTPADTPGTTPARIPDSAVASPSPSPSSRSSIASAEGRPKKRSRPKTVYNFAQPPPTANLLHLRPKVLLQLHQVIQARRPKPVYEVVPFSLLAPRSTRRLVRTFNSRDRLGPHDLLIVKAEEYGSPHDEEKSDDERWGARDVIGVICPGKEEKGIVSKTELLLDDGSNWEVTSLPNGGYEFNYTDQHGLTLRNRWVPKLNGRRVSTMSNASLATIPPVSDKKFTFSTIASNTRRHPIIATMNRTSINVQDSYVVPTATSPPTPSPSYSTPMATPCTLPDLDDFIENAGERLSTKTDDALRRFIVISGIWVAFSENWSAAYSSFKPANYAPPLFAPGAFRTSVPTRAVSMSFLDSPRSVSPASTIDENRRSVPKLFRSSTHRLHRNSAFSEPVGSPTSTKSSPASSPPLGTRARRSNSLGDDIRSRTGSTRKRFGLALEDQTLLESEEERQSKRSIEILRLKELTLPSPTESTAPKTPAPIRITEPSIGDRSHPLVSPTTKSAKTQSAFNPVTTAGLWDSGIVEGPGIKRRPTSMVIVNEKKEKAKRKQERSKSKDKYRKDRHEEKEKERDGRKNCERIKQWFMGVLRKEKS